MATVFLPPTYRDSDLQGLTGLGRSDTMVGSAVLASMGTPMVRINRETIPTAMMDWVRESEMGEAFARNKDLVRVIKWKGVSEGFNAWVGNREVYGDYDAAIRLWELLVSGKIKVDAHVMKAATSCEVMARSLASVGCTAGFVTPVAGDAAAAGVPLMSDLAQISGPLAAAMCMADPFRLGSSSSATRDAFVSLVQGVTEFDMDSFVLRKGGIADHLLNATAYHLGPYTVVAHADRVYILGQNSRNMLADTLWRAGMWVMQGMSYRRAEANGSYVMHAYQGFEYVRAEVARRVRKGKKLQSLAKHMKTCYAVSLALFLQDEADEEEVQLTDNQAAVLLEEAVGLAEDGVMWSDVMAEWPGRVQVDMGTAWNMLPADDADPVELDAAIKGKLNASREYDGEAWSDFISYSMSAISAAIVVADPQGSFDWDRGDAEELKWVKACRSGCLTYPPVCDRARIVGHIPWEKHLEGWVYTAKDVTHVYADLDAYSTYDKASSKSEEEACELLYAGINGSVLSGKYSPEDVRRAWERGEPLGDRVMLEAAKKENTKYGNKVRETMSADDVMRESLTEVDVNVARLSPYIDGMMMRASRRKLEATTCRLTGGRGPGVAFLSLDITGWSPNMSRRGEMEWTDALLMFFKDRNGVLASTVFRDVHVVACRQGYHSVWEAIDGSIQGFFGTSDTALHTMMAQWAFRKCKDSGHITKGAKMTKAALIDDILIKVVQMVKSPQAVADAMALHYKALGFDVDKVKGLVSKLKGHFLNRLYSDGREIVTSAKIFAKADRAWEQQWVSVHNIVDSVFGSMRGAADRGADVIAAYTVAMWRSSWILCTSRREILDDGASLVAFGAWLPRSVGGLGLPNIVAWQVRESTVSLESGIGTVCTLARVLKNSDRAVYSAIVTGLHNLMGSELSERSLIDIAEDPMSVTVADLKSPESVLNALHDRALSKMRFAPELDTLVESLGTYEAELRALVGGMAIPAAAVSEYMSSLPHMVGRAFLDKYRMSERLIRQLPRKVKESFRYRLRKANKRATGAYRALLDTRPIDAPLVLSGSDIAHHMRKRMHAKVGSSMTCLSSPSSLDVISQVPGANDASAHVKVMIPALSPAEIYDGSPREPANLVRSSRSAALVEVPASQTRESDPVSGAYARMAAVVSYLWAIGVNADPLEKWWMSVWTGEPGVAAVPRYDTSSLNPARLSGRVRADVHTVCSGPNTVGQIKVDMSTGIRTFERTHLAVPWMSIAAALKAVAYADVTARCGQATQVTYKYALRLHESVMYDVADCSLEEPTVYPACALSEAGRRRASHIVGAVSEVVAAGVDEEDEEGARAEDIALPVLIKLPTALSILTSQGMARTAKAIAHTVAPPAAPSRADVAAPHRGGRSSRESSLLLKLKDAGGDLDAAVRIIESNMAVARALGLDTWVLRVAKNPANEASKAALSRHLEMATSGEGVSAYYSSMADSHSDRAQAGEWRSHFMAAVCRSWALASAKREDWGLVVVRTLEGFQEASVSIVRRHTGSRDVPKIPALMAGRASDILSDGKEFANRIKVCVGIQLPVDWQDRQRILDGAYAAAERVHTFLISDWVEPAARAEKHRMIAAVRSTPQGEQQKIDLGLLGALPAFGIAQEGEEDVDVPDHVWEAWAALNCPGLPKEHATQDMLAEAALAAGPAAPASNADV